MMMTSDSLSQHLEAIPFVPDLGDDGVFNSQEWNDQAMEDSPNQFKIRLRRVFFIVSGPLILLITAPYVPFDVSFIIGIGLLFMFIMFFFILFRVIFFFRQDSHKDYELYRVYSMSQRPPKWAANLDIGYIQLLYKNQSIQSISELCAIHGGVTKSMLNTLGAYTWIAVTIHYIEQIKHHDAFRWDTDDIFAMIGTMGLLIISVFELDPFNKKMRRVHSLGALLGTGTIFAFNLQQRLLHNADYSIYAIITAIIGFVAFIGWNTLSAATELSQLPPSFTEMGAESYYYFFTPLARCFVPNYNKISISSYSKMNIGFEAVFLFTGAFSLSLFLMDYNNKYETI